MTINGRRTLQHVFFLVRVGGGIVAISGGGFPQPEHGTNFGKILALPSATALRAAGLGSRELTLRVFDECLLRLRVEELLAKYGHV